MTRGSSPVRLAAFGVAAHLLLLVAGAISLAPFAWMACAAFKRPADVFGTLFLPVGGVRSMTLQNFARLFDRTDFLRWLVNSLFISCTQTTLVVTLSSLGGFALAKYRFAGKRLLMAALFASLMIPGLVLLPGAYLLMYHLRWLDTFAAVILPGAVSAFGMLLFRQAMLSVPDELLHSARLDGCGELRLWWEIALPIVRPMIGAYTLLSFLSSWNSYLWPQVMLQDQARFTLPVGLAGLLSSPEYQTQYGVLMAGTLLSVVPVVVLFFALERDFVSGLTSGALKA